MAVGKLSSAVSPDRRQPVDQVRAVGALAGHRAQVAGGDGHAVEGAVGGRQQPDGPVALVGDEDVPAGIDGQRAGVPELGVGRRAAVPGRSAGPVAGHRVDVAPDHRNPEPGAVGGGHQPQPAVAGVGDEEVPGGVDGHAGRVVEPAPVRRPPVAGEPGHTGAGDGHRSSRGGRPAEYRAVALGQLLDPVGRSEGDEQVAARVEGQGGRRRMGGRAGARPAGDGGDVAGVDRPPRTSRPICAGTSRTRQLPVSAMNRSPAASSTIPAGASSSASTALCPSPPNPGDPVPATVIAPAAWA